jgi:hypothetical protein
MPTTREVLDATIALEKQSMALYVRFAKSFAHDAKLQDFWFAMARDEARHVGALDLVTTVLDQESMLDQPSPISLEDATILRLRALLDKAQPKTGEYPASVASTWALNFQEVEQDPVAADILRVSAFLSPDAIPLELLSSGASQLGPVLAGALAASEDPLALNEAWRPESTARHQAESCQIPMDRRQGRHLMRRR